MMQDKCLAYVKIYVLKKKNGVLKMKKEIGAIE